MKIIHLQSLMLSDEYLKQMTEEVRVEYEVFLENHLRFIKGFLPVGYEKQVDIHNMLLAFRQGKIIGYRYYFYSMNKTNCELFNIYVDSKYRRLGIASLLLQESINKSIDQDVVNFTVRMASENDERQALFDLYKEIANQLTPKCKFVIYYGAKETIYQ